MELINKQYALASAISGLVRTDENGEKWIRVMDVRESIMNVPAIEAEPIKHGRWINQNGRWHCSECGMKGYKYPYCPYCGADMRGEVRAFTDEELKTYQEVIDRKSIPTSVNIMNIMDGGEND